jgi:uncharacterized protein YdaU (DUF1376 family)
MNYYKRHLGDYAKHTSHLTVVEHGLYNLFLDWYYVNEKPIPPDLIGRLARGYEAEARAVLMEFFTLSDDGWRSSRADEEIREYHKKAKQNQEVGKLGGRPRKTEKVPSGNPEETQTVSKNNPDVTQAISHKPVTIREAKAEACAPPASRGHRLPDGWQPSDDDVAFAVSERVNWRRELESFRDYWESKSGRDAVKLDWSKTWRNWIRKAQRQPIKPAEPAKSQTYTGLEKLARISHGTLDFARDRNGSGQAHLLEAAGVPRLRHDRDDGYGLD